MGSGKIIQLSAKLVVIFFAMLILTEMPVFAAKKMPLPLNQAFILTIDKTKPNEILLNWQIAPGYYLYHDRVKVNVPSDVLQKKIEIPQGELKYIPNEGGQFQREDVFYHQLTIPIYLEVNHPAKVMVHYQGCSESGFCYPPQKVYFDVTTLKISEGNSPKPTSNLVSNQHEIKDLFKTQNNFLLFIIFLGLGLLLSFTPCVLPMIPILTSIIVGQKNKNIKTAFLLSLTYVLAMALTYAIAGIFAAMMGSLLQLWLQTSIVIILAAVLFGILGFSLFGFFEIRLPNRLNQSINLLNQRLKGGNYIGVAMMGILSTLIVSPCVTAPLVGVLMYISEKGSLWIGGLALFAIGLGMGLPLIIIALSADRLLPKTGIWMESIKLIFGLLMFAMAIWLLARILTSSAILVAIGLLIVLTIFIFYRYFISINVNTFATKCLLLNLGIIGALLISNPLYLSSQSANRLLGKSQYADFIIVKNTDDLDQKLLMAKKANQPVILDFYADWCESCVLMDKKVFSLPKVKEELNHYVLLRADLSANSFNESELLKNFNVVAPPTILFFDTDGIEMKNKRIIGSIDATHFIASLTQNN